MNETNSQEYYQRRAAEARRMAENAQDAQIGAIHAEMAASYERLSIDTNFMRLAWSRPALPRH